MTPGNFDWFLHTMLFLQTQYVLNKQENVSVEIEELEDDDGNDGGDCYKLFLSKLYFHLIFMTHFYFYL
jgi:hypothetical protein